MLPKPASAEFPKALKTTREAKGLSYSDLARLVGIHPVMPARYENLNHSNNCRPRSKTWNKLNAVLFGESSIEKVSGNGATPTPSLGEASVEEIIKELKARGASSVNVSF